MELNNELQENAELHKKQSKRYLVFYVIALFSIALVMILLSYMTQVRADRSIKDAQDKLSQQVSATEGIEAKRQVLQAENEKLIARVAELEQATEKSAEELTKLNERIAAQEMLMRAMDHNSRGEVEPAKTLLTEMETKFGEKLTSEEPEKLIWSAQDAQIYENLKKTLA